MIGFIIGTILSFLFGSLFGFIMCACIMSENDDEK